MLKKWTEIKKFAYLGYLSELTVIVNGHGGYLLLRDIVFKTQ